MQKYGQVTFIHQHDSVVLDFVWIEKKPNFERIDLIEDFEQYSQVDSSLAVASYFKKTKELLYGDDELIRRFLRARSQASIFHAKTQQSISVVDGHVIMSSIKEDLNLGMCYKIEMRDGIISSEYIQTPDVIIEVSDVSVNKGMDNSPVNISSYFTYDLIDGMLFDDGEDGDYYSVDFLRARYGSAIDHLFEADYRVVENLQQGIDWLKEWADAPDKIKSVDLEGTGLDNTMLGEDVITGVVLSYNEDQGVYFPIRQDKFDYNLPVMFLQDILDAVNNQPKDVIIVAHNGKYEDSGVVKEDKHYICFSEFATNWYKKHGMDGVAPEIKEVQDLPRFDYSWGLDRPRIRIDADTYLLSVLLNPVMQKGLHTLKSIAFRIRGRLYLELNMIFKGKIKFNCLPPELVRIYACPDTANTIAAYKALIKLLPDDEHFIYGVENSLMPVKACSEFYGMREDKERLVSLIENEEYKVKMLGDIFKKFHNITGNINSNDVKRDIFYNRLRAPVEVLTKTGKPSTSSIAVERIVDVGTIKDYDKEKTPHPILDLFGKPINLPSGQPLNEAMASNRFPSLVVLMCYNKCTKELGALRRLERKSHRDRVFFNINQVGAGSGRQSSDAHQYSDTMKSIVLSDSPWHYLCSADYKQVELRVLAFLARQLDLIALQRNPEIDIHRAILSIIKKIPMWMITELMRKLGKSVNFGVVYMMSEYGLAKKNAGPAYTQEDLIEALKSITDFYNGLPFIKKFVSDNAVYVKEHGYIKTAFGRYRYFPEILDPTLPDDRVASIVRAANNTPVQGFAADLLKMVERNIWDYIRNKGWDVIVDDGRGYWLPMVRVMLSIHDEVLVSSHKSIPVEEIMKMLKICMEIDVKGAPPFFAAPAFIDNWYDGKNDAYECPLLYRDEIVRKYDEDGTITIDMSKYLEQMGNYRAKNLESYMDDLVRKYKEPAIVAEHVRHDDLTHVLISAFLDKGERKKLDHLECIALATERYMSRENYDPTLLVAQDESRDDELQRTTCYEDLEPFIQVDQNGELIMDESQEDEDDPDDLSKRHTWDVKVFAPVDRSYVFYTPDTAFFDLTGLDPEDEGEEVNQYIYSMSDASAFYKVVYTIQGKIINTGLRIDYHADEINEKIRSIVKTAENKY